MEIKNFCSLGTLCHTSQLLKRNNLKKCSYPFDWIYSNCNIIMHCLKDNFNIFLDKTYYTSINEIKCGHSYYHERMFNHHNPLNNDYEYFIRCVNRFKTLLKSSQSKLFILMYVNMNKNEIPKAIHFNSSFSKYTSNYILLVIHHEVNKIRHHYFEYKDNIHILYLYTLSESDGKEFKNNDDNFYLDTIINMHYKLRVERITFFEKIIKMLHLNQMPNLFQIFLQGNTLIRGIQKS
jgi:hypothetical protein